MIAFIQGTLIEKTPTWSVIKTGGIGFRVLTPLSTFGKLGEVGEETILQTVLYLREETVALYGFATSEEKGLFLHLISVSGIGPKLALGVLSGIPVADFKEAVRHQDIPRLTKTPGIGKKTAERLVLELKEKLEFEKTESALRPKDRVEAAELAINALVEMGIKRSRARDIVQEILRDSPKLSIEETVFRALQKH